MTPTATAIIEVTTMMPIVLGVAMALAAALADRR